MVNKVFLSIFLFFTLSALNAQSWSSIPQQEEELGYVNWVRSYSKAIATAKKDNKPIFILFQEVPGCSTCKNYGNHLLTHPHIVEVIETYFVPLAIHNNKSGKDAEVLQKFGEPSWNNPVARIIDPQTEKDIVDRLSGKYDMESLIGTLSQGILASNQLIPNYLVSLLKEYSASDVRETHFSMYCFWSGEKILGSLDGVISTKAGFMNGAEVVKIKYDANRLKEDELIAYASDKNCADEVYSNDQREIIAASKLNVKSQNKGKFRADSQPKYYTFNSDYKYLPMTNIQALKVNTALSNGRPPNAYLSPRQLEMLSLIKEGKIKAKIAIDQDFTLAWNKLVLQ